MNVPGTWDRLARQEAKGLYAAAYFITRDVELAREVVHDTIVSLMTEIEGYEERGRFLGWAYTMCMNRARNAARVDGNRRERLTDSGSMQKDVEDDPRRVRHVTVYDHYAHVENEEETPREDNEDVEPLREKMALMGLPPDTVTVVLARDVQGSSYEEISEQTGMDLRTIVSYLHDGRLLLRDAALGEQSEQLFQSDEERGFLESDPRRSATTVALDYETAYRKILEAKGVKPDIIEATILQELYGATQGEIAELQNVPQGTIMSRTYRGRDHTRAYFDKETIAKVFGDDAANTWGSKEPASDQTGNGQHTKVTQDEFDDLARKGMAEVALKMQFSGIGLNKIRQEAYILFEVYNLSLDKIAEVLRIHPSAARERVKRGRNVVRKTIGEAAVKDTIDHYAPSVPILPAPEQLAAASQDLAGAELDPAQQEAILLRGVGGLSIKGISIALGISLAAANSRVTRGRERIRAAYGEEVLDKVLAGNTAIVAEMHTKEEKPQPDMERADAMYHRLREGGIGEVQARTIVLRGEGLTHREIATLLGKNLESTTTAYKKAYHQVLSRMGEEVLAEVLHNVQDEHVKSVTQRAQVTKEYEVTATDTRDRLAEVGLDELQADMGALRWGEGKTIPEIAAIMGLPMVTVRSKFSTVEKRAKAHLGVASVDEVRRELGTAISNEASQVSELHISNPSSSVRVEEGPSEEAQTGESATADPDALPQETLTHDEVEQQYLTQSEPQTGDTDHHVIFTYYGLQEEQSEPPEMPPIVMNPPEVEE